MKLQHLPLGNKIIQKQENSKLEDTEYERWIKNHQMTKSDFQLDWLQPMTVRVRDSKLKYFFMLIKLHFMAVYVLCTILLKCHLVIFPCTTNPRSLKGTSELLNMRSIIRLFQVANMGHEGKAISVFPVSTDSLVLVSTSPWQNTFGRESVL